MSITLPESIAIRNRAESLRGLVGEIVYKKQAAGVPPFLRRRHPYKIVQTWTHEHCRDQVRLEPVGERSPRPEWVPLEDVDVGLPFALPGK